MSRVEREDPPLTLQSSRLTIPLDKGLRGRAYYVVAAGIVCAQSYVPRMRNIPETEQERNHTPPFLRRSSALAFRAESTKGASVFNGSAVLIKGC